MADIFQTSVSGLLAFQRALATTSHNISNVNTAGYSRQTTEFATREPHFFGGGYVGTGVESSMIRRMVDENRNLAVRDNTSEFGRLETFSSLTGRIDNLLADKSAGLAPSLQSFFGAVQKVANDPGASPSREVLLTEAQNLVSRFGFVDQRMEELERDVNSQIKVQISEVNQYAESIARLNEEIVVALGRSQGAPPNDLLDKRDQLLTELSQRISTRVVPADNGAVNVFIGNGQSLVVGKTPSRLEATENLYDRSRLEVSFVTSTGSVNVTRNLTGGSLGGLFDFRREVLDPVRNQVGVLATSLAVEFNQQHRLGMQFDTDPPGLGGDFFSFDGPQVLARTGNSAGLDPTLALASINEAEVSRLDGSDYQLSYDGADWVLSRVSDGNVVATITPPATATPPGTGLTINTAAITGAAAGDSFLIRPTRTAAASLDLAVSRASEVAAARPVVAGERVDGPSDPNPGQSSNTGTGTIGGLSVATTQNLPLAAPITLTFDAAANQFVVSGGPGGTLNYDPATQSAGVEFNLPAYGDMRFTIRGVPEDGDAFVIESNSGGTSDGGNMLELGKLQSAPLMQNSKTTFSEFYSSTVAGVGATTLRANVNRDAQEVMLTQANAAREEVSGVNLEEEAANMLRYQQAYQASAQVVTVARSLFDSLLAAVGR